jgi:hypothetical protein
MSGSFAGRPRPNGFRSDLGRFRFLQPAWPRQSQKRAELAPTGVDAP